MLVDGGSRVEGGLVERVRKEKSGGNDESQVGNDERANLRVKSQTVIRETEREKSSNKTSVEAGARLGKHTQTQDKSDKREREKRKNVVT